MKIWYGTEDHSNSMLVAGEGKWLAAVKGKQ